jgi:hypothetical protein
VALLAAQIIAGMVVPMKMPAGAPNHMLAWVAATDLLVMAALGLVAARSEWRGWKLGVALAAIPLTIAAANWIEGAVYLVQSKISWSRIAALTTLTYALVTPLWVLIFGRKMGEGHAHYQPFQSQTTGQKIAKFLISDVAYLLFYLTAGFIIFPFVKDFYATQTVPTLGKIAALQLLIRAPMFIGICLLLVRTLGMSRTAGAITAGLVFAVLSGVAPLLIPVVGWIWGQTKGRAALQAA